MTPEDPQIDFVLGETDGAEDEDLPQPRQRDFSRLSRFRRPVLGVAALGVVIGAVVAVNRSSQDSTPVAQRSTSPSATAPVTRTTRLDPATGKISSDAPVEYRFTGCAKDSTTCITSVPLGPDLGTVLRSAFPTAHLTAGTTNFLGPRGILVSRTIHASDGSRFIAVEVRRSGGRIDNPPPAGLTGVEVDNGKYTVFATVVGRTPTSPDPYAALNKLASDPRIVS
ncbi:MAG: hypothetical protein ABI345_01460 [Jatrophihabitans sp.]